MDLYAENILDHFKHPRGKSPLAVATFAHGETNVSCGDTVRVEVALEGGHIAAIGWSGEGCAVSQAAMSMLAEELRGKSLADIDGLTPQTVRDLLGVPISVRRSKCAFLGLHALKNLLHISRNEPEQAWQETVENPQASK